MQVKPADQINHAVIDAPAFAMFPRLFCAIVASLCAISTAFRDVEVAPNKVFAAYEEGFVGQSDDPRNLLRERINEGAHDSTAKPISQAAVATREFRDGISDERDAF